MSTTDNRTGGPDEQREKQQPDRLASVWTLYREACPDPEPSPNFMPRLWREIEARRAYGRKLARFARAVVALAAASCAVMFILLFEPGLQPGFYDSSYVDVLASTHIPSEFPADLGTNGADNTQ